MTDFRRWRWLLCAAGVWAGYCLVIAILAYLNPRSHTVFPIYAVASRAWWAGEDMFALQAETTDIYRYSPVFAVLISPFATLLPGVGNAAWKLTNVAAFAIGLWVWCRRGLPCCLTSNQTSAVFLLSLPVAAGCVYNGQANLLLTGLVLLGLTAAVEDRWWLAAGSIAAATLIKAFPLALAIVLSVLFWRTFPLRFLAALLAGLALPFATQRPEYVLDQTAGWVHHLTESVELNRERLRSLDKMLELAGLELRPQVFLLLGALAGLGVLAAAVWTQQRGASRPEVMLRLAAWFLTWAVLFIPSSENATYAIVAPVVSLAIVDSFSRPNQWGRRLWLLTSLYLLGSAVGGSGGPAGPLNRLFGWYCWVTLGGVMFQAVLVADLFAGRTAAVKEC